MPYATMEQTLTQILAVLGEGFEGPSGSGSYFVDNDSTAGMIGTLATTTTAEASLSIGGSTIASHVSHMIFALEASSAWIRGDRSPRTWRESWRLQTMDVEMSIGGAIGSVAHAAYHLGVIRQKLLCIRRG